MSSRTVYGFFLALAVGALAACNSTQSQQAAASSGRPIRDKNPASESPIHVQGGSMTLICNDSRHWTSAGSGYACNAADTSVVIFEDDNSGGSTSTPPVSGPWVIYVYGSDDQGNSDKSQGVKLCTSQDSSSGVCDMDAGAGRGNYVALTARTGDSLKSTGDDNYMLNCSKKSCDNMTASYFSANGNTYPCKASKNCHVGIGPKAKP